MNRTGVLGRSLYAIALLMLGMEHFTNGNFPVGPLPIPAGLPGRPGLVYVTGILLVLAGIGLLIGQRIRLAALLVSGLFGLVALAIHLPLLVAAPANGGEWTVLFECLALSAGALLMTGPVPALEPANQADLTRPGQWLFAWSLVVFGILHFVYAVYIATLIPAWMPAPLFWAYFVGVAFLATAVSIVLSRLRPLSTALLGLMFLLWVALLHAPRVAVNPQIEAEWTSLSVALAMSGSAFGLAGLTVAPQQRTLPV